jgi:ribonucleoside-diphosphate reductase alpha chain
MSQILTQIKKRDGHITAFDDSKIEDAVYKAFLDSGVSEPLQKAKQIKELVLDYLDAHQYYDDGTPDIETIQNLIEYVLLEEKFVETARKFMVYREEKRKLREKKKQILQYPEDQSLDELDKRMDVNQLSVLAARYLLREYSSKDDEGKIIERPSQLFKRVATLIGLSDLLHDPSIFSPRDSSNDFAQLRFPHYNMFSGILESRNINEHHFERFCNLYRELDSRGQMKVTFQELMNNRFEILFDTKYKYKIDQYYWVMTQCYFMPNTPTLMNGGTANGGLSACFVLEAPDSIDAFIRGTLGDAAQVFKTGGGVGINWSLFRPEGSEANGKVNAASGPVSFILMIDSLTDVVKQGGGRRGANMGILDINAPDIEKFITVKTKPGVYENLNLSVGIWPDFWEALTTGKKEFQLTHPSHKEMDKVVDPNHLWELIAQSAWRSAEPGVIFFDNINKVNHMIDVIGPLRSTNPCAEQALEVNGSCTLGSINLARFVRDGEFDYRLFEQVVRLTTRFLDNVLDMNKYPTQDIEEMALNMRRIGLGIMGLADALFMLKIPYNRQEGFHFMESICHRLTSISIDESVQLAVERGAYPFYRKEQGENVHQNRTLGLLGVDMDTANLIEVHGIRNSWNTTIAPTGTISMIAGCSGGCEPAFAMAYEKKVTIGRFFYKDKYLEKALKEEGIYSDDLIAKIADNGGSLQNITEIPEWMRNVFVTSMDIHWADHVMAQAVCQRYIDNSISKTINFSKDILVDDIKNAYLLAHELGCKGLSVYRDGSRKEQVLHTNSDVTGKQAAPSDYTMNFIQNIQTQYVKEKLNYLTKNVITLKGSDISEFRNEELYVKVDSGEMFIGVKDGCPLCKFPTIYREGCEKCINEKCGWGKCASG